ncbi:hypothetical protein MXD62_01975 [Frankia sp. Mgl5]|uniref:hypothetical protein n=1 Tax=Frankia sp. Mgl5 TaxID=2933793 RepID=UPI00200C5D48|nr:hypothetical protein [Frankia sp. Mgl5]MCK9925939.1 hypothetical protein [Frankia sp. Mgl5]
MPTDGSARFNDGAPAPSTPADVGVLTRDGLAGELQKLGWGRGLNTPAVETRVGPMLTFAVRRDGRTRAHAPGRPGATPNGVARATMNRPAAGNGTPRATDQATTAQTGVDSAARDQAARDQATRGRAAADRAAADQRAAGLTAEDQAATDRAAVDGAAVDRAAVGRWLRQRLPDIPDDLAVAAQVFFGIHPQAQHRFLSERLDWLGDQWGRDRRTVRRRVDEALALIAEAAVEPPADGPPTDGPPADGPAVVESPGARPEAARGNPTRDTWYTERLSTLLRLDRDVPEATEARTIVATVNGVDTVTLELSVPPDGSRGGRGRDLGAEILYGGILLGWDRPSASHFRLHVELPGPLRAGDRHKLGIALRVVDGAPMAPHYVCVPLGRLTEFEIRVRFSPSQAADGVEVFVLDGVPPRVVDDDSAQLPRLGVDRAGEVHMQFHDLRQGRGYGLRWVV